ncbi:MAG: hypothetical protein ABSD13_15335 [Candidatus Korobacteraceae bacterium]|jgi:hypothetical protein
MPEDAINQISAEIRTRGAEFYPERGELRALRIVGRTPKTDHYIYDLVAEFASGSERLAVKLYRTNKHGQAITRHLAAAETNHLRSIWSIAKAKNHPGIPQPLGDFSELGAVVSEKLTGIPLQSIIMKAALLPGYAGLGMLQGAATASGTWLRTFQRITAQPPQPLDGDGLQLEMEKLCHSCKAEGLDDDSISKILSGTRAILDRARKPLTNSAVLSEFTPLNVIVQEHGVGFSDFARMQESGSTYLDPATFLASVEALEKYPFCNRIITTEVQENFLDAYQATEAEREILRVFKMKVLLSMFAAGRTVKESAVRKKVMWANVMKKFIQAAADRSLPKAA